MKKHILKISIAIDIILLSLILFILFFIKPSLEASNDNYVAEAVTPVKNNIPATPIPSSEYEYIFKDKAVRAMVEDYFEKSESEFSDNDFSELSRLDYLAVTKPVKTLADIPLFFPRLRYIEVSFDEPMPQADCDFLAGMERLKAVEIHAPKYPSFEFLQKLVYVNLRYNENVYAGDRNRLADASVLGGDFISKALSGHIKEYVRVFDGDSTYEMFSTDYELQNEEQSETYLETKVFISKAGNQGAELQNTIDVVDRIDNAVSGLEIIDVDFDGNNDILVAQGGFGVQLLTRYSCFLSRGGTYEYCPSFSEIPNVSVDKKNSKLLGSWRNSAGSHSWAMYEFIGGQFVQTDCLTQEMIEDPDEDTKEDHVVWEYIVEGKHDNGTYSTNDYTEEEIYEMFVKEDSYRGEESYWKIFSSKWRPLNVKSDNMGEFSYGDGKASINQAVEAIILASTRSDYLNAQLQTEEFAIVSGAWKVAKYLGESVEVPGVDTETKEYQDASNKVTLAVTKKYLGKTLVIEKQNLDDFGPNGLADFEVPNYYMGSKKELYSEFRQDEDVMPELTPPFLCIYFKLKGDDDYLSMFMDATGNAYLKVKGSFFQLERI